MSTKLKLDPNKTALVLIDLQNGIVSRDTKPHTAGEVIERSRALAEAFRAKGAPVVYVRVLISEVLSPPSDEAMNLPKDIPASASEIAYPQACRAGTC